MCQCPCKTAKPRTGKGLRGRCDPELMRVYNVTHPDPVERCQHIIKVYRKVLLGKLARGQIHHRGYLEAYLAAKARLVQLGIIKTYL